MWSVWTQNGPRSQPESGPCPQIPTLNHISFSSWGCTGGTGHRCRSRPRCRLCSLHGSAFCFFPASVLTTAAGPPSLSPSFRVSLRSSHVLPACHHQLCKGRDGQAQSVWSAEQDPGHRGGCVRCTEMPQASGPGPC